MAVFRIGLVPADNLYGEVCFEFVAEAQGETLHDACVEHAAIDPSFADSFDPHEMTAKGRRIVSLDHYTRSTLQSPF